MQIGLPNVNNFDIRLWEKYTKVKRKRENK